MPGLVSLVKANRSTAMIGSISKSLELIGFEPNGPVKSAVIKPNLCYYWDASTGYTTDPKVVGGVIDWIREKFGDVNIKVAEADASAMRTKYVFPVLGYEKLAKEKNVELLNLSDDVLLEKAVQVNGSKISFKVPQVLLESDLFINVPKLKIMRDTKITCAMKNIFGCIGFPRKIIYHSNLSGAIVGINKILRPHLTIVDGLVALGSLPVKLGLMMASEDPFSIDWIASRIMGFEPSKVNFLRLATMEKLGNPNGIIAKGESVTEFERIFPKTSLLSSNQLWRLQFWLLNAYRRISGDIIPPFLDEG